MFLFFGVGWKNEILDRRRITIYKIELAFQVKIGSIVYTLY